MLVPKAFRTNYLSHRFIEVGKDFPLIAEALPGKVSVKSTLLKRHACLQD